MAKTSNGTTFAFPTTTTVLAVRNVSFSYNINEIDITDLSDSTHTYETGIPDVEATIEVLGASTIAEGGTGPLAITWGDGGSDSIGTAICVSNEITGSLDTELVSSLTFRPSD